MQYSRSSDAENDFDSDFPPPQVTASWRDVVEAYYYCCGSDEFTVFLSVETGAFLYANPEQEEFDETPDDLDEKGKYIVLPDQFVLDLGNRLAFRFARTHMPEDEGLVRDLFKGPGAYQRFKSFLDREDQLDAWYAFEKQETEKALREWCAVHGIAIRD